MAKKAMVEREKKRAKMVDKYWDKRQDLLDEFRQTADPLEKLEIHHYQLYCSITFLCTNTMF